MNKIEMWITFTESFYFIFLILIVLGIVEANPKYKEYCSVDDKTSVFKCAGRAAYKINLCNATKHLY
jgi:hypothetical protein